MVRVKQCCCGCSLRTGTLILLWFGVIYCALTIFFIVSKLLSADSKGGYPNHSYLLWNIIVLVITIYGLVGVNNKRPSFLLPYIIVSVLALILLAVGVFLLMLGSAAFKEAITDLMDQNKQNSRVHFQINTYDDDDGSLYGRRPSISVEDVGKVAAFIDNLFTAFIFIGLILFALNTYFLVVVYSYYKELQDEVKGTHNAGVVYSAPIDQKSVSNPSPYNNYPPAYGQQSAPYPQSTHPQPTYPQLPA